MPAYVINDMEITDPIRFEEYKRLSPSSVAAYGGRFLARGGPVTPLEGNWEPKRMVLLEFPNVAQAQAWLDSQEYAPARRLRQLSAKARMVVIEGTALSQS